MDNYDTTSDSQKMVSLYYTMLKQSPTSRVLVFYLYVITTSDEDPLQWFEHVNIIIITNFLCK